MGRGSVVGSEWYWERGAKPDGLVISRNQIQTVHFYQYEHQHLSLSVLLFILPLYNSLLFHFSSKRQESTVLFTFTWLNL